VSKLDFLVLVVVIVLSFSAGYWPYILLANKPSTVVAQFLGLTTTLTGFFIFVVVLKYLQERN